MKKSNNKPQRIDKEFAKQMKKVMEERYRKGLAPLKANALSLREATYLARTCPSWPNIVRELKTLPKKKK